MAQTLPPGAQPHNVTSASLVTAPGAPVTMEQMLEAPERIESTADEAEHRTQRLTWWRSLHAASTRRALMLTALGGLLIAVAHRAARGRRPQRRPRTRDHPRPARCRDVRQGQERRRRWPERNPDAAEVVDCKGEHRFEVAESVDMRTFPGSEYGPDAAPPSPARIQQISQEQCQVAVRRYLADRFDPNSRFTVSMMWSGDKAWRQSGERRMLCGLQLPGANNSQLAFQGKVAEVDQSKIWPAGTRPGIDPSTNQPTDIPVDCAGPHAMEVTGAVNAPRSSPPGCHPSPSRTPSSRMRAPGSPTPTWPRFSCAYHAHADLQHPLAAQLVGGQPSGVVQHRRHARQRRVVDTAQQRRGSAADQRPAPDSASGHPPGAAELPADPDARHASSGWQHSSQYGQSHSTQPPQSTQQTQQTQRPSTGSRPRTAHPSPRHPRPRRRPCTRSRQHLHQRPAARRGSGARSPPRPVTRRRLPNP